MKNFIYFDAYPQYEKTMKLEDRLKGRKVVINEEYIKQLPDRDWHKKLKEDLTKAFDGGEVYLCVPSTSELMSRYTDIRAQVAFWAIKGRYTIKVNDSYDGKMIKSLLAGKVTGNLRDGYRFQYA